MQIISVSVFSVVFLSVYCLPTYEVHRENGNINMETEREMENRCTEIWCESYSLSYVQQRYKGLFLTNFEMRLQTFLFGMDRDVILYKEGVRNFKYIVGSAGDGDSCCVTKQSTHINYKMKNIFGETRYIVHLTNAVKPKYQYVTQAKCIGVGKCDGLCVLEDTVRTLLVYDIVRRQMTFDQILVPTYCSCKRGQV